MDVINCTDDDQRVSVTGGRPCLPEEETPLGRDHCLRIPARLVPNPATIVLCSEKYGALRLDDCLGQKDDVVIAMPDSSGKPKLMRIPRAEGRPAASGTLAVNCTKLQFSCGPDFDSKVTLNLPPERFLTLPPLNGMGGGGWKLFSEGGKDELDLGTYAQDPNDLIVIGASPAGEPMFVQIKRVRRLPAERQRRLA